MGSPIRSTIAETVRDFSRPGWIDQACSVRNSASALLMMDDGMGLDRRWNELSDGFASDPAKYDGYTVQVPR
jgi:hypothetical protein